MDNELSTKLSLNLIKVVRLSVSNGKSGEKNEIFLVGKLFTTIFD